ncbi:hypothetical protein TNCV_3314471 [Trichonephila clavipes]|nr:hypothetical protein TNCV_3314471 [Trichonephila clavipes]
MILRAGGDIKYAASDDVKQVDEECPARASLPLRLSIFRFPVFDSLCWKRNWNFGSLGGSGGFYLLRINERIILCPLPIPVLPFFTAAS